MRLFRRLFARRIDWEQRCADLYQAIAAASLDSGVIAVPEPEWLRMLDYAAGLDPRQELLPWPKA